MVLNTAVLSCVLLVSTITMQICTSIYTSHITLVFLHDPKMCSLLISQMLCVSSSFLPRGDAPPTLLGPKVFYTCPFR